MDLYNTRNSWAEIWQSESGRLPLPERGVLRRRWRPDSRLGHYLGVTCDETYLYMLKLPAGTCAEPVWPRMDGCLPYCCRYGQDEYFCLQLKRREDWAVFKLLVRVVIRELEFGPEEDRFHLIGHLNALLARCSDFFKSGSHDFGEREAKGLLGELYFLEHYVVPAVGWEYALSCWCGPQGTPQDFAVLDTTVEIKCTQSANRQYIHISSSRQLDTALCTSYLCVVGLAASTGDGPEYESVSAMVERLVVLFEHNTGSAEMFLAAVSQTGYSGASDAARKAYRVLGCTFYEIREDFPRIRMEDLPLAVVSVKYSIDLLACSRFVSSPAWVK